MFRCASSVFSLILLTLLILSSSIVEIESLAVQRRGLETRSKNNNIISTSAATFSRRVRDQKLDLENKASDTNNRSVAIVTNESNTIKTYGLDSLDDVAIEPEESLKSLTATSNTSRIQAPVTTVHANNEIVTEKPKNERPKESNIYSITTKRTHGKTTPIPSTISNPKEVGKNIFLDFKQSETSTIALHLKDTATQDITNSTTVSNQPTPGQEQTEEPQIGQKGYSHIYKVNSNYKRYKKLNIVPSKPFQRDPNDNSWRNESISSLGIKFTPKANTTKTIIVRKKELSEVEALISDSAENSTEPGLRERLERLSELRKSKKKQNSTSSLESIERVDFEDSSEQTNVDYLKLVEINKTSNNVTFLQIVTPVTTTEYNDSNEKLISNSNYIPVENKVEDSDSINKTELVVTNIYEKERNNEKVVPNSNYQHTEPFKVKDANRRRKVAGKATTLGYAPVTDIIYKQEVDPVDASSVKPQKPGNIFDLQSNETYINKYASDLEKRKSSREKVETNSNYERRESKKNVTKTPNMHEVGMIKPKQYEDAAEMILEQDPNDWSEKKPSSSDNRFNLLSTEDTVTEYTRILDSLDNYTRPSIKQDGPVVTEQNKVKTHTPTIKNRNHQYLVEVTSHPPESFFGKTFPPKTVSIEFDRKNEGTSLPHSYSYNSIKLKTAPVHYNTSVIHTTTTSPLITESINIKTATVQNNLQPIFQNSNFVSVKKGTKKILNEGTIDDFIETHPENPMVEKIVSTHNEKQNSASMLNGFSIYGPTDPYDFNQEIRLHDFVKDRPIKHTLPIIPNHNHPQFIEKNSNHQIIENNDHLQPNVFVQSISSNEHNLRNIGTQGFIIGNSPLQNNEVNQALHHSAIEKNNIHKPIHDSFAKHGSAPPESYHGSPNSFHPSEVPITAHHGLNPEFEHFISSPLDPNSYSQPIPASTENNGLISINGHTVYNFADQIPIPPNIVNQRPLYDIVDHSLEIANIENNEQMSVVYNSSVLHNTYDEGRVASSSKSYMQRLPDTGVNVIMNP